MLRAIVAMACCLTAVALFCTAGPRVAPEESVALKKGDTPKGKIRLPHVKAGDILTLFIHGEDLPANVDKDDVTAVPSDNTYSLSCRSAVVVEGGSFIKVKFDVSQRVPPSPPKPSKQIPHDPERATGDLTVTLTPKMPTPPTPVTVRVKYH